MMLMVDVVRISPESWLWSPKRLVKCRFCQRLRSAGAAHEFKHQDGPKMPENGPKMNPYSLNTDSADSLIPFIPVSPYLLILLSLYPLTPFSPIPLFPYPISLQHDLGHGIFNKTTFLSPYPLYPLTPLSPYPPIPLSAYPLIPLSPIVIKPYIDIKTLLI